MNDEQIIESTVATDAVETQNPTPEIIKPPLVIDEPIIYTPAPEPAIPEPNTTLPSPVTVTDISAPPPPITSSEPTVKPIVTEKPLPIVTATPPEPEILPAQPELKPAPTPVITPVHVVLEPPLTTHPSPITETFDVTLLSDEQLKAAAALYTKRNQAEISKKGVAKRQETMELSLREIVDFLSLHNGSPLPRIAKHTNITLGTTSKYLCQLNSNGKVRAEGWGKTRRYYLK